MIKYNLICRETHEFEAWFSASSDYDVQRKKRLIHCPHCGSDKVEKAIMAPNVSTSRKKEAIVSKRKEAMAMMNKAAQTIRKEIEEKCDYVGERFAMKPALFITARKRSVLFMAKPVRKRQQSSKRKGSALRLCQMF